MSSSTGSPPLTVAGGLDVVILNENEVLIQHGTRSRPSELLRDTELRGFLGPLMARLVESPATAEDLRQLGQPAHQTDVQQMLDDLLAVGILAPAAEDLLSAYLRYSFGAATPLVGRSAVLVGAGPLGARIGAGLLQHGLGSLTVLDSRQTDEVWNRFAPLGVQANGAAPAAQALVAALGTNGGPRERVRVCEVGFDDLDGLEREIGRHDLLVAAFERPHLRLLHLINRVCLQLEKPWLLAQIDGSFGIAGPLFSPPDTACYNCFRTLLDTTVPSKDMAERYRRHLANGRDPSFFPGLPAHCDLVAGYTTLGAVHFLARRTSFLLGRALMLDFGVMGLDLEDVLRLPRCPACSRSAPALEPPFAARIVETGSTAVTTTTP